MAGSDTNANYIAQWNQSSWSAFGSMMNGYVLALAVSGGTLYARRPVHDGGHQRLCLTQPLAYLPVPPTLSIIADGTNMVLKWPDVPTGYTTGYTL